MPELAHLFIKMEFSISPTMVLWDPNFTPDDAHYLLSFKEQETKTNMVKDTIGLVLPDEYNQDLVLKLPDSCGDETWVADWETFLAVAKPEQIEHIKSVLLLSQQMSVVNRGKRTPVGLSSVWDMLPKSLRKRLLSQLP